MMMNGDDDDAGSHDAIPVKGNLKHMLSLRVSLSLYENNANKTN